MNALAEGAPFLLLLSGFLAAVYVAVSYNIRIYKLQKRVHDLAKNRGEEWVLWGNLEKMSAFVVRPTELALPKGNDEVLAAGLDLLAHRQLMIKTALKAGAFFVTGFIFFIAAKAALLAL